MSDPYSDNFVDGLIEELSLANKVAKRAVDALREIHRNNLDQHIAHLNEGEELGCLICDAIREIKLAAGRNNRLDTV